VEHFSKSEEDHSSNVEFEFSVNLVLHIGVVLGNLNGEGVLGRV